MSWKPNEETHFLLSEASESRSAESVPGIRGACRSAAAVGGNKTDVSSGPPGGEDGR